MDNRKAELQQLGGRIRDSIIEKVNEDREEKTQEDLRKRLFLSLGIVVLLLVLTWLAPESLWNTTLQIAALIPLVVVNRRVFMDGFSAVYSRKPEKNTLAAIGTIVALLMLQFATAGIFLATMAMCRWSEAYVNCKLDDHLKRLIDAEPEDPQLEAGSIITVGKGEVIPADGTIIEGISAIDEEIVTGERVPQDRGPGEPAFAGTKNLSDPISVRVERCGRETTLSRIIDHITVSIATRAPIADRADRSARFLVFAAIILAVLSAALWMASGSKPLEAATTAVTILIIASPYAFSVAVPMSILAATVRGAKNGIMIRSADILELARDINTIAMNKTGTVTDGKPEISDIVKLADGFSLRLAGILEQEAEHPAGREIHRAAQEMCGELPAAEDVQFFPGRGLRGTVDGKTYLAGNAMFLQENGIRTDLPEAEPLFTQGKSVVFFASETRAIGLIAMRDAPKPISMKAISRIEGMGIDVVMLTGDSAQTAEAIRSEVGIDRVYAGIRPQEKAEVIEELRGGPGSAKAGEGQKLVAMVGDGIEDAPAIAKADIGIAVGTGPRIDAQRADVILIADDLMDVVRSISLSRKTIRYIRQDIAFAYCYNILAVAAAASVLVPLAGTVLAPVIAALCMCASQVLVVASTMRIKRTRL